MKRRGPMKRSPWPRAQRPERRPPVLVPLTRRGVSAPLQGPPVVAPKLELVRSPTLREAYRLIPCQWPGCGREDGTVCCAHSNWAVHGKGGALKAGDDRGAALCHEHHSGLDQGGALTRAERQAGWWAAHVASVEMLSARGLWPAWVPLPGLDNPFELDRAA